MMDSVKLFDVVRLAEKWGDLLAGTTGVVVEAYDDNGLGDVMCEVDFGNAGEPDVWQVFVADLQLVASFVITEPTSADAIADYFKRYTGGTQETASD
jgi:hypothetical protein